MNNPDASRFADGRVVVVTGGASGIGKAIADAFTANGDRVAVLDRSGVAGTIAVDVSDEASVKAAFAAARSELGTIDVLVNSAGLLTESPLEDMTLAMWNETIAVDLTGVFLCCREVVGTMRQQRWGRIINIASVSGIIGNAGQVNYSASKAGVIGMTKSIARELAGKQVTANCVAPGFITTDMTDVLPPQIKDKVLEIIPLRRFGNVADIGAMVAFLASDKAGYVTGQVIAVDGGMTM